MAAVNPGFVDDAWSSPHSVDQPCQPLQPGPVCPVQPPPPAYQYQPPVITQPAIKAQSYVGHVVLAVFALIIAFPFGLAALILAGILLFIIPHARGRAAEFNDAVCQ